MSFDDRLKKIEVTPEKTSPFPLPEMGPEAIVHLAHAGEANEPYFNARFGPGLAKAKQAIKRGKAVEILGAELDLAARRDLDRKLYPVHIIKGWDHVLDAADVETPYSEQAARDLCDALCKRAKDVFDRMRNHAADIANYRDDVESMADLEEVAKN